MAPKQNAFVKYALMRKKESEAEGVAVPDGLKGAIAKFGPEWQTLSPAERLRFKNKLPARSNPNGNADRAEIPRLSWKEIKTTHGLQLGEIMEEVTRKQYLEELRRISTTNVFKRKASDDLPLPEDQEFVIIEFSTYTTTNIPAEVALTAFSLRRGIVDSYSTLIDPETTPMGFAFEFRVTGKALGVPLPGYGNGCSNYKQILRNIDKFLKHHPTERNPTLTNLYCLREEHAKVRSCLEWLTDKCGVKREYYLSSLGLMLLQFGFYGKKQYLRHLEMMEMLKKSSELKNVNNTYSETEAEESDYLTEPESIVSLVSSSSSKYGEGNDPINTPCHPGFPIEDGRHRARRIPHTSVHQCMVNPIYKFTPEASSTSASSSVQLDVGTNPRYWGTPTYGEDETPYCMVERTPDGPKPDNQIFMFEGMAGDFLGSMDLAFCMELACSHHAVNGIGVTTCALNVVNRYAYNIIDVLLGYFPAIFPMEGAHYPLVDPVKEAIKRRNILFSWGRDGYTGLDGYKDSKPKVKQLTEEDGGNEGLENDSTYINGLVDRLMGSRI